MRCPKRQRVVTVSAVDDPRNGQLLAGVDNPRFTPSIAETQASFLVRRFRLAPDRARLVAELAFKWRAA